MTWFDESSKTWKLIGVVSYGSCKEETKIDSKTRTYQNLILSSDQRCAGHWPNVFAKVEHVLSWMKAVIDGHPLPQNVMTGIQGVQNSETQNSRKLPERTLPQLHSEKQNFGANQRFPSMQPCKRHLILSKLPTNLTKTPHCDRIINFVTHFVTPEIWILKKITNKKASKVFIVLF